MKDQDTGIVLTDEMPGEQKPELPKIWLEAVPLALKGQFAVAANPGARLTNIILLDGMPHGIISKRSDLEEDGSVMMLAVQGTDTLPEQGMFGYIDSVQVPAQTMFENGSAHKDQLIHYFHVISRQSPNMVRPAGNLPPGFLQQLMRGNNLFGG